MCRPNVESIGLPFLITVPESRLTYTRLTQLLEGYSRYNYTRLLTHLCILVSGSALEVRGSLHDSNFQVKTANLLSILALHLHHSGNLEPWQCNF